VGDEDGQAVGEAEGADDGTAVGKDVTPNGEIE